MRPAPGRGAHAGSLDIGRLPAARPDARTGRTRARRLCLLPVIALLLGALSLFAAAPTLAQGTTPAAPTSLDAHAGDQYLYVDWTAPTGTLTGYDVHYTSAPASGDGSVSNTAAASGNDASTAWVAVTRSGVTAAQVIQSLTNDTAYRVRVRATNANGDGAWAFDTGTPTRTVVSFGAATLSRAEGSGKVSPSPISVTSIPASESRLRVRRNPASTAGLSDFRLQTLPVVPQVSPPGVDLSFFILDDSVNEEHETAILNLEVGPNPAYDLGTQTTLTVTITDNDPPEAPTGLTQKLGGGDGTLTARWNKPAGPVTQYQLRYKEAVRPRPGRSDRHHRLPWRRDPSTGWNSPALVVHGPDTSGTIPGLSNGTTYHVQVRATDGQTQTGNGYGAWSATQTGTAADPNTPGAPWDFRASPNGPGELRISWRSPLFTLGGVPLTGCCTDHELHYTTAAKSAVGRRSRRPRARTRRRPGSRQTSAGPSSPA